MIPLYSPAHRFGERTPRHMERKMSLVKMTINLLWDVDGWMSKGKRWVGTAEVNKDPALMELSQKH